ncbi:hypothetical protein HK099_007910 [Clydaea vesicula]|uniref:Uncharacterized protein n=1 Tax=Clydaea vesicula TaxID=447962 RepID=A0AAD5TY23_9FUNG|nr:hypothetical protein HK099_007910 [Clydaea vesicula]
MSSLQTNVNYQSRKLELKNDTTELELKEKAIQNEIVEIKNVFAELRVKLEQFDLDAGEEETFSSNSINTRRNYAKRRKINSKLEMRFKIKAVVWEKGRHLTDTLCSDSSGSSGSRSSVAEHEKFEDQVGLRDKRCIIDPIAASRNRYAAHIVPPKKNNNFVNNCKHKNILFPVFIIAENSFLYSVCNGILCTRKNLLGTKYSKDGILDNMDGKAVTFGNNDELKPQEIFLQNHNMKFDEMTLKLQATTDPVKFKKIESAENFPDDDNSSEDLNNFSSYDEKLSEQATKVWEATQFTQTFSIGIM